MVDVALTGTGTGDPPPPPGECNPGAPTWLCYTPYSGNYVSDPASFWEKFILKNHNPGGNQQDALALPHPNGCGNGCRFAEPARFPDPIPFYYGNTYAARCIGFTQNEFGLRGGYYAKIHFNDERMLGNVGGQHLMNIKSHPQTPLASRPDDTTRWDIHQPDTSSGGRLRILIRNVVGPFNDQETLPGTNTPDPFLNPWGTQQRWYPVPQWGIDATVPVYLFFRWHHTISLGHPEHPVDRNHVALWFNNSTDGSDSYTPGDPPSFTYDAFLGSPPMGNIFQFGHFSYISGSGVTQANFRVYVHEHGLLTRPPA